ncbi:hypothetical protein WKI71_36805 [Streptomyces sp. MS1.AVA.1]|uniref:GATA-type domain-containing protein n=1 Tax=Streptomyces machairae TaxID=3134109 RepID=A0ABU8UTI0_9ACTN
MITYTGGLALAVTFVMAGLTVVTRHWPARSYGLHRRPRRDPLTLDTLIGPESAYTSYATLTDVQPLGPIRQGFGWCEPCGDTTAGSINRDGFLCGRCFTPAGGERR